MFIIKNLFFNFKKDLSLSNIIFNNIKLKFLFFFLLLRCSLKERSGYLMSNSHFFFYKQICTYKYPLVIFLSSNAFLTIDRFWIKRYKNYLKFSLDKIERLIHFQWSFIYKNDFTNYSKNFLSLNQKSYNLFFFSILKKISLFFLYNINNNFSRIIIPKPNDIKTLSTNFSDKIFFLKFEARLNKNSNFNLFYYKSFKFFNLKIKKFIINKTLLKNFSNSNKTPENDIKNLKIIDNKKSENLNFSPVKTVIDEKKSNKNKISNDTVNSFKSEKKSSYNSINYNKNKINNTGDKGKSNFNQNNYNKNKINNTVNEVNHNHNLNNNNKIGSIDNEKKLNSGSSSQNNYNKNKINKVNNEEKSKFSQGSYNKNKINNTVNKEEFNSNKNKVNDGEKSKFSQGSYNNKFNNNKKNFNFNEISSVSNAESKYYKDSYYNKKTVIKGERLDSYYTNKPAKPKFPLTSDAELIKNKNIQKRKINFSYSYYKKLKFVFRDKSFYNKFNLKNKKFVKNALVNKFKKIDNFEISKLKLILRNNYILNSYNKFNKYYEKKPDKKKHTRQTLWCIKYYPKNLKKKILLTHELKSNRDKGKFVYLPLIRKSILNLLLLIKERQYKYVSTTMKLVTTQIVRDLYFKYDYNKKFANVGGNFNKYLSYLFEIKRAEKSFFYKKKEIFKMYLFDYTVYASKDIDVLFAKVPESSHLSEKQKLEREEWKKLPFSEYLLSVPFSKYLKKKFDVNSSYIQKYFLLNKGYFNDYDVDEDGLMFPKFLKKIFKKSKYVYFLYEDSNETFKVKFADLKNILIKVFMQTSFFSEIKDYNYLPDLKKLPYETKKFSFFDFKFFKISHLLSKKIELNDQNEGTFHLIENDYSEFVEKLWDNFLEDVGEELNLDKDFENLDNLKQYEIIDKILVKYNNIYNEKKKEKTFINYDSDGLPIKPKRRVFKRIVPLTLEEGWRIKKENVMRSLGEDDEEFGIANYKISTSGSVIFPVEAYLSSDDEKYIKIMTKKKEISLKRQALLILKRKEAKKLRKKLRKEWKAGREERRRAKARDKERMTTRKYGYFRYSSSSSSDGESEESSDESSKENVLGTISEEMAVHNEIMNSREPEEVVVDTELLEEKIIDFGDLDETTAPVLSEKSEESIKLEKIINSLLSERAENLKELEEIIVSELMEEVEDLKKLKNTINLGELEEDTIPEELKKPKELKKPSSFELPTLVFSNFLEYYKNIYFLFRKNRYPLFIKKDIHSILNFNIFKKLSKTENFMLFNPMMGYKYYKNISSNDSFVLTKKLYKSIFNKLENDDILKMSSPNFFKFSSNFTPVLFNYIIKSLFSLYEFSNFGYNKFCKILNFKSFFLNKNLMNFSNFNFYNSVVKKKIAKKESARTFFFKIDFKKKKKIAKINDKIRNIKKFSKISIFQGSFLKLFSSDYKTVRMPANLNFILNKSNLNFLIFRKPRLVKNFIKNKAEFFKKNKNWLISIYTRLFFKKRSHLYKCINLKEKAYNSLFTIKKFNYINNYYSNLINKLPCFLVIPGIAKEDVDLNPFLMKLYKKKNANFSYIPSNITIFNIFTNHLLIEKFKNYNPIDLFRVILNFLNFKDSDRSGFDINKFNLKKLSQLDLSAIFNFNNILFNMSLIEFIKYNITKKKNIVKLLKKTGICLKDFFLSIPKFILIGKINLKFFLKLILNKNINFFINSKNINNDFELKVQAICQDISFNFFYKIFYKNKISTDSISFNNFSIDTLFFSFFNKLNLCLDIKNKKKSFYSKFRNKNEISNLQSYMLKDYYIFNSVKKLKKPKKLKVYNILKIIYFVHKNINSAFHTNKNKNTKFNFLKLNLSKNLNFKSDALSAKKKMTPFFINFYNLKQFSNLVIKNYINFERNVNESLLIDIFSNLFEKFNLVNNIENLISQLNTETKEILFSIFLYFFVLLLKKESEGLSLNNYNIFEIIKLVFSMNTEKILLKNNIFNFFEKFRIIQFILGSSAFYLFLYQNYTNYMVLFNNKIFFNNMSLNNNNVNNLIIFKNLLKKFNTSIIKKIYSFKTVRQNFFSKLKLKNEILNEISLSQMSTSNINSVNLSRLINFKKISKKISAKSIFKKLKVIFKNEPLSYKYPIYLGKPLCFFYSRFVNKKNLVINSLKFKKSLSKVYKKKYVLFKLFKDFFIKKNFVINSFFIKKPLVSMISIILTKSVKVKFFKNSKLFSNKNNFKNNFFKNINFLEFTNIYVEKLTNIFVKKHAVFTLKKFSIFIDFFSKSNLNITKIKNDDRLLPNKKGEWSFSFLFLTKLGFINFLSKTSSFLNSISIFLLKNKMNKFFLKFWNDRGFFIPIELSLYKFLFIYYSNFFFNFFETSSFLNFNFFFSKFQQKKILNFDNKFFDDAGVGFIGDKKNKIKKNHFLKKNFTSLLKLRGGILSKTYKKTPLRIGKKVKKRYKNFLLNTIKFVCKDDSKFNVKVQNLILKHERVNYIRRKNRGLLAAGKKPLDLKKYWSKHFWKYIPSSKQRFKIKKYKYWKKKKRFKFILSSIYPNLLTKFSINIGIINIIKFFSKISNIRGKKNFRKFFFKKKRDKLLKKRRLRHFVIFNKIKFIRKSFKKRKALSYHIFKKSKQKQKQKVLLFLSKFLKSKSKKKNILLRRKKKLFSSISSMYKKKSSLRINNFSFFKKLKLRTNVINYKNFNFFNSWVKSFKGFFNIKQFPYIFNFGYSFRNYNKRMFNYNKSKILLKNYSKKLKTLNFKLYNEFNLKRFKKFKNWERPWTKRLQIRGKSAVNYMRENKLRKLPKLNSGVISFLKRQKIYYYSDRLIKKIFKINDFTLKYWKKKKLMKSSNRFIKKILKKKKLRTYKNSKLKLKTNFFKKLRRKTFSQNFLKIVNFKKNHLHQFKIVNNTWNFIPSFHIGKTVRWKISSNLLKGHFSSILNFFNLYKINNWRKLSLLDYRKNRSSFTNYRRPIFWLQQKNPFWFKPAIRIKNSTSIGKYIKSHYNIHKGFLPLSFSSMVNFNKKLNRFRLYPRTVGFKYKKNVIIISKREEKDLKRLRVGRRMNYRQNNWITPFWYPFKKKHIFRKIRINSKEILNVRKVFKKTLNFFSMKSAYSSLSADKPIMSLNFTNKDKKVDNFGLMNYSKISLDSSTNKYNLDSYNLFFKNKLTLDNKFQVNNFFNKIENIREDARISKQRYTPKMQNILFRMKPGYSILWRKYRSEFISLSYLNFYRQRRLTNYILNFKRSNYLYSLRNFEFSIFSIVRRSLFFLDYTFSYVCFNLGMVFLNGKQVVNKKMQVYVSDVVQISLTYSYLLQYRWLFFYINFRRLRFLNKYMQHFFSIGNSQLILRKIMTGLSRRLFKKLLIFGNDIPNYLEVDYFTMISVIIYEPFLFYEFDPILIFRVPFLSMRLYNWKYSN